MQRTGFLALGAVLLALFVAPQANAAVGVAKAPHAAASEVHHVTFERDKKHKKLKHYKHHKKHKKHKHKKHH